MTIPLASVDIHGISYAPPLKVVTRAGAVRTPHGWELTTTAVPGPVELDSDAVGSWWQLDRAVERGGSLYWGDVQEDGTVIAGQTNLATKTSVVVPLIKFSPPDDHNNPGIYISATTLVYAVTQHNGTTRVWRASNPADVTTLGAPVTLTWPEGPASYMQLRATPAEATLGLLTRSPGDKWYVRRSVDAGATWLPAQKVITFAEQGYIATVQVGAITRCLAYEHPFISTDHRIWRFDINLDTGAILNDAGATIGTIGTGIAVTDATLVYDPAAHPGVVSTRICDISAAADVEICFIAFTPTTSSGVYMYARKSEGYTPRSLFRTGRDIGYDTYHGGMSFPNPSAGGTVYVAAENGFWTVDRCQSANGFAAFTRSPISGPQSRIQARPYAPVNRSAGPEVIWTELTRYASFTNFAGRKLAKHW